MPREIIEAITADPEYATFSADQRDAIMRAAIAKARSKPALVTKAAADPTPQQTAINKQAAASQARKIPPGLQQPVSPAASMAGAVSDRLGQGLNVTLGALGSGITGALAPTARAIAEDDARKAPPIQRAAASSLAARRIVPNYHPDDSPVSNAVVNTVEPIKAAFGDVAAQPSRLLPTAPGAGEGYAAAATDVALNVLDPVGDAMMVAPVAGLALGAKLASKGAAAALRGADAVAGDFAGRLGQAAAPAITAAAPKVRAVADTARGVLGDVADVASGRVFTPEPAAAAGGRRGSIKVTRPAAETFTPAQVEANRAIERSIRELSREAREATPARQAEIAAEIQSLDDARVVIPKPDATGVQTIADLQARASAATAAGNTAEANRLTRQAARMRAGNYHNATKYAFLGQEGIDKYSAILEKKVAEMWAQGRDPRTPVPFATVRRQAAEILPFDLEQTARKGLKKGESLTAVEYEAAKNYMQQLVEESVTVERRVNAIQAAQTGGPPAVGADGVVIPHEQLNQALTVESARQMQLEKDVAGLAEIVTQSRSQKGRDLAYLKMVAQQGWDIGYWTARANRTSGGVATNQQISRIGQIVTRGQAAEAAGDMVAQRATRIELAKAMGELTITPWPEALLAARKAGLLSGVKTIARNAASNTLNIGLEELVNVIGAVPDALLAMRTGRRTVFASEAANIGRAFREVRGRGIQEALETQIHGMPLDQLAALDVPREINTPSRAFNAYVNHIMRFQSAQDRLFKAFALRRSLDSQARALAVEAARLPGPRPSRAVVNAHARHLADNPTEAMMMEAVADAEFATFQNDTVIATALTQFKRGLKQGDQATGGNTGRAGAAAMDVLIPFIKTPSAIGARVLDYAAGLGTQQAAHKRGVRMAAERAAGNVPEWMTREEQRAISKGFARQAVGATLVYMGARWYEEGRLTGTDQMDRREENQAAGRTGNAIKIRDQWIPLNPFSPIGNLLTLGATMARDGAPDGMSQGVRVAMQVAAMMLDQPFTQGAKQMVEVLGDTEGQKLNRLAAGVAGSVVPSALADVAAFADPSGYARSIDYSDPAASLQAIQARLPGLRNRLPIKYDGLGNPVEAPYGLEVFAAGAGRTARENFDPVAAEVLTTGADVPRADGEVSVRRDLAPAPLTNEEKMQLIRQRGEAARRAVQRQMSNNPAYVAAESPDVQRDMLNRAISKASATAKQQYINRNRGALMDRAVEAQGGASQARGRRRAVVNP